jgi:hypothetical protein
MGMGVYPNRGLESRELDVFTLMQMHRHLRGAYAIC